MSDEVLESFTRQYINAHKAPEITFAWQGGEPTLIGVDFYKKAIELQQKYCKTGMHITNSFQTNGVNLNDDWGKFFSKNQFLVGLSIDGPRKMHDTYRVDKAGKPTFYRVIKGLDYLKKHNVDFNILACVHAANADHPKEVYHFFRDRLKAQFIQFIPIVERKNETGFQEGDKVTNRSVTAKQFGNFLIGIFDEWVKNDVGEIFIQTFDVALGAWLGRPGSLCVFAPTCGTAMVLEHNGDLYSCDHFVEPKYYLGNIMREDLIELVNSKKQMDFGEAKLTKLPSDCLHCEARFACHGGCPKNRFIKDSHGEDGLNYLCAGYKEFFRHIDQPMRTMANLLRINRPASDIMQTINASKPSQHTKKKKRHRRH